MDAITHAKQLIIDGQNAEKDKPENARRSFLQAASILVNASKEAGTTDDKQKLVDVANGLYWRAHTLQQQVIEEGGADSEPEERIKALMIAKPKTRFKDIGGLQDVKDDIRLKIIAPFKHPEVYAKYGKKAGGGILMFGPPGCGKSLLAEATAGEADVAFFNVKPSDLKSKFVGETERNIASLFKVARAQPNGAIIFFDEFESLGGDRTEAGTHDRHFVSQLLTEMDGVGNKDQKVLLVAATNLPWSIDIALRREGRFGQTVFVPPPDLEGREYILRSHTKNKPLAKDLSFKKIAEATKGFSGADLKAVCEAATDIPLKEFFRTNKARDITMDDFVAVTDRVPSTRPWFAKAKEALRQHPDEEIARKVADAADY